VPGEGVEPSRPMVGHWVLSPTRLPIPPPGQSLYNNYMKNKNILQSFKASFEGFFYIYKTHKHIKLNLLIALLILFFSIILNFTPLELLVVILAILLIFFTEGVNTCIEEICNLITTEYHPKIKAIKDIGSFLVLIAVIFSLSVAIFIFLRKIL
jgi:diacylglycerol kinase (ATP)